MKNLTNTHLPGPETWQVHQGSGYTKGYIQSATNSKTTQTNLQSLLSGKYLIS